jgi:hypothetical protein
VYTIIYFCYNIFMIRWLVWVMVAALYSPVICQLYRSRWETIDYTHAYFILPISLFLIFRNGSRAKAKTVPLSQGSGTLLRLAREPSLLLVMAGLSMFIFGWKLDYFFITTLSLIPLLYGMIIYLYGAKMAKALSFPIVYLLLMVPPP